MTQVHRGLARARSLAARAKRAISPAPAPAPTPSLRGQKIRVHAEPEPRWSACYAPHTSMYFDQFGKVRACCQNTGVYLGDITTQTLREVWESADAERMRSALEADDYSAGCEFCEWQVREGNESIVFARQFDVLQPERGQRRPTWPRQMEFSVTNTCNLACEMCNGDWSSTIRAKREGRPPLPAVYGEDFFEQLAPFLPQLDEVAFLGGEPFLGAEPLRIMEMLAELPDGPRVTITTNGTIFTARVKRIIEMLDPYIVVSLDGASTEVYDRIRIGGHFPEVLANIDRYRDLLGPGRVSLTHCLMSSNWHEFADFLTIAEDRDILVGVNVVRFPEVLSLYHLPADELDHVVSTMRATDISHLTGRRRSMWEGNVTALENRLAVIRSADDSLGPAYGLAGASNGPSAGPSEGDPGEPSERYPWPWIPFEVHRDPASASVPEAHVPEANLQVDTEGVLGLLRPAPGLPFELDHFDGGHVGDLTGALEAAFGPQDSWSIAVDDGAPDRMRLTSPPAEAGVLVVDLEAVRAADGSLVGATYRFEVDPAPPADTRGRSVRSAS
ncbi:MAG: Radical superfamily enzyme [Ilumatobacteraceae bacterium]|nr:Radical superfamily enzyme [Ilumatobacteraceae bacterium]